MSNPIHDSGFERLSELLDQEGLEEQATQLASDEGRLLLELREELQGEDLLSDLPEGFATSVAARSKFAMQQASPLSRAGRALLGFSFQRLSFLKSFVLILIALSLGLGSVYYDPAILWLPALSLVILVVLTLLADRFLFAGPSGFPNLGSDLESGFTLQNPRLLGRGLQILPALNLVLFGLLSGWVLASLGSFSLVFRESVAALWTLGVVGGLALMGLAAWALSPLNRVCLRRTRHSTLGMLGYQGLQAGIFWGLTWSLVAYFQVHRELRHMFLDGSYYGTERELFHPVNLLSQNTNQVLSALVFWVLLLALGRAWIRDEDDTSVEYTEVSRVIRKSCGSLVIAGGLLALACTALYQGHLSRELYYPDQYEALKEQIKQRQEKVLEIPESDNGWFEIVPLIGLEHTYPISPEAQETRTFLEEGLKGPWRPAARRTDHQWELSEAHQKQFQELSRRFRAEVLPSVEKALARPRFSSFADSTPEEQWWFKRAFGVERNISLWLVLLAEQAFQENDFDQAVHLADLALRWSAREEYESLLIHGMVRLSMLDIASEPLERWLSSGQLNTEQVQRLQQALVVARPSERGLLEWMQAEIIHTDQMFLDIASGNRGSGLGSTLDALVRFFPVSFVESERIGFLNRSLPQLGFLHALETTILKHDQESEKPDFTILADSYTVFSTVRARAGFVSLHSRLTALETMAALERYRIEHGVYPYKLEQLVPEFLSTVPIDLASPGVLGSKKSFEYQRVEDSYRLISESPAYPVREQPERKVYGVPEEGPDG